MNTNTNTNTIDLLVVLVADVDSVPVEVKRAYAHHLIAALAPTLRHSVLCELHRRSPARGTAEHTLYMEL